MNLCPTFQLLTEKSLVKSISSLSFNSNSNFRLINETFSLVKKKKLPYRMSINNQKIFRKAVTVKKFKSF